MGKLVGFDVGLAVLPVVAKVVDEHWGGALEGVNLLINTIKNFPVIYGRYLCCSVNRMSVG